jgi:DNA-directed RNA polymerase II subunit RPB11
LLDIRVCHLILAMRLSLLILIAVPHPLFAKFELRVQTDGEITPKEAVVETCKSLVGDLEILSREFTKEVELRKMVSGGDIAGNQ